MRNKIITMMLIGMLMFVTACGNSTRDPADVILQTGTNGLVMDFKKGFPEEVFEQSSIYTNFEISNEGYADIEEGIIVPSLEQDLIELKQWEHSDRITKGAENILFFQLRGKTLDRQNGEKQIASMILNTKKVDNARDRVETSILLSACYRYTTILSDMICIDTDLSGMSVAEKTCEAKEITSSSQGAPVAITRVDQNTIPSDSSNTVRMQFTIYAENKGNGIIIDADRYKEICIGENAKDGDYNMIYLKSLKFSDYQYLKDSSLSDMECTNPMKESKEGYYTVCELKEGNSIPKSKATFQTPIVIELEYGYKISLSDMISVLDKEQSK